MNSHNRISARFVSLVRLARHDKRGQVLPWVAFMMMLFLGIGAFVLDVGHAYYCFRELQAATDAAALAGALQLKASTATSTANNYAALSGSLNSKTNLGNVSMVSGYPVMKCLTTINIACPAPNNANAVQVKEQATVPTFFARIFGVTQMSIYATATAALSGAKAQPLNVAIILDTTASMTTVDSNCNGGQQRVVCAEQGVQILLQSLSPCNPVLGCGSMSSGDAQYPLDSVAMFTFPPVSVGTAQDDYNCGGKNPTITTYTLPTVGSTTYAPTGSSSGTYQVTPFLSDYRSSDSASDLSTSSDLSMTVGGGTNSKGTGCNGLGAPGGDGTYYAGVIYAAQAALTAQYNTEMSSNPNVTPQNVMIILTDGEANASSSKMASTEANGTKISTSNTFPAGAGATSSLTNYPSSYNQCQQAVAAANYSKGQGTLIYTVAYGSESSGCTTDSSGPQPNISPCSVMSEMASGPAYFYSDYLQSGSGSACASSSNPITNMNEIFTYIGDDFLHARLIPDSTQ